MDDEDFNSLMRGMREVADYDAGAREGFVTHVPPSVDVRAIRKGMRQTQQGFAHTYGFSVGAERDWEQGRRQPERAARILLAMIAHEPQTVERVIRGIG